MPRSWRREVEVEQLSRATHRESGDGTSVRIGIPTVLLLCAIPALGYAQEDGWSALGSALGGGNRAAAEEAYQQGREDRALAEARYWEQRRLDAEAKAQASDESIRAELARTWLKIGYSATESKAMANAYVWTDALPVMLARARREGAASTIPAIRSALDSYNYALANQLLLCFLRVSADEHAAAAAASSGRP